VRAHAILVAVAVLVSKAAGISVSPDAITGNMTLGYPKEINEVICPRSGFEKAKSKSGLVYRFIWPDSICDTADHNRRYAYLWWCGSRNIQRPFSPVGFVWKNYSTPVGFFGFSSGCQLSDCLCGPSIAFNHFHCCVSANSGSFSEVGDFNRNVKHRSKYAKKNVLMNFRITDRYPCPPVRYQGLLADLVGGERCGDHRLHIADLLPAAEKGDNPKANGRSRQNGGENR
jgi:hypothetical protein